MSEFQDVTLVDFLLTKYLDRAYHLFGYRFDIDRHDKYLPGAFRGFWIDRYYNIEDGTAEICLHWFKLYRTPVSEKRKAQWAAWRAQQRIYTPDGA